MVLPLFSCLVPNPHLLSNHCNDERDGNLTNCVVSWLERACGLGNVMQRGPWGCTMKCWHQRPLTGQRMPHVAESACWCVWSHVSHRVVGCVSTGRAVAAVG
jgi:hypothetical protein